ncbi:Histone-lysine N-methyltransferase SETMAR [Araneus ventricosus]|uniref:Histone-lysine N-methyltransferase SETMAR n=1 Tax=Araneus ventricosus TaxID=182803 RepID=A0A4Y2D0A7_ARAVE|nr:Histone-lysine N-methyltransferase SETMAR [Araneus ventricosus]
MIRQGVVLLHDARPHSAGVTQNLIQQFGWEQFNHPLYSPDLAPSDYHLFLDLKRDFGGRRYDSDGDAGNDVQQWLSSLAATFFEEGIDKLVSRYDKCLNNGAPIAPEKRLLLSVNSTALNINLNSWHNGGCPICFFVIQYRPNGQQEWTLVSNNVIPEQNNITITDLSPGSWYSLLITARNDAGSTDAEYKFATLTLSGEYPPRPSKVSDMSGSFYRHLTITVPVVSSIIVLFVVLFAVCFITRRRTSGTVQRTQNNDSDGRDPIKAENVPLSVTYDAGQDPTYLPAPYATSRVSGYNREHCILPGSGNEQNVGTFGSTRSGYTYNVPHPPRRVSLQI